MKIIKYTTRLNEDKEVLLVREAVSEFPCDKFDDPAKVTNMINAIYNANRLTEEFVWMIALDTKCKSKGIFEISHGSSDCSIMNPREIFTKLCLCGARNFILIHNHPSGECCPSPHDINITDRIQKCGMLMDIQLLDHIIVGDEYFSFEENNLIKPIRE